MNATTSLKKEILRRFNGKKWRFSFSPSVQRIAAFPRLSSWSISIAPHARAIEISTDGIGEAALLPYYIVTNARSSVMSVTNHGDVPSVARIVIAEGRNGRVALSFNVYLAAQDSWHAAIVAPPHPSSQVAPRLVTGDASCKLVPIGAEGTLLRTDAFIGSRDDGLGASALRTYQGQVEVIELGTLTGPAAALVQAGDCVGLRDRFAEGGVWRADPNADVSAPAGNLGAELQIVDVASGVAFGVEPLLLRAFSAAPRHDSGYADYQAARIFKPTLVNAQGNFDVPNGTVSGEHPADAVSLLMMSSRIEVPFSVEASVAATTEVVLAFPTRPAYLDNNPWGELVGETQRPFRVVDFLEQPGCETETHETGTIDRAGKYTSAVPLVLCEQVNVIALRRGNDVDVDAALPELATGNVSAGRLRIEFDHSHALSYTLGPVADNARAYGLPAMALSLIEVRNADAQPGLLASYAITGRGVRHREGAGF